MLDAPNPVLGADNRRHLAYEVRLQNSGPFPVALRRLDALDRRSGAVLARHAGAALAALVRPAEGGTFTGTIGPGRTVYAVLEVALPRRARVPHGLTHRISIAFDPRKAPPGFPNPSPYAIAPTTVAHHRAVVLASPLRGSGWVAANGCCNELTSHRGAVIPVNGHLRVPERFAIDWVKLDAHGRMFTGPVGRLSSYAYYGTDVLSVAAGTVVRTHDGEPEQTPPNPPSTVPTPDSAGGNWVMVDLGDGNFAFYAHLQRHSLAVRVGDRVRRGSGSGSSATRETARRPTCTSRSPATLAAGQQRPALPVRALRQHRHGHRHRCPVRGPAHARRAAAGRCAPAPAAARPGGRGLRLTSSPPSAADCPVPQPVSVRVVSPSRR